jgi:hypothetical protein
MSQICVKGHCKPASRIYGITAVALYESIVAGTKKNESLELFSVPSSAK